MTRFCRLLDCTLRDGSYIVNADFGEELLRGLLKRLYAANVDIIECGWLKNQPHQHGSAFFHLPDDLLSYLPEEPKADRLLTAMIDWDRYDLSILPPCSHRSIDAIRMVFPHGKATEALALAKRIPEQGYQLFLQAANTLSYSDAELVELAKMVNGSGAKALSIVDTFGAMYPVDLERITRLLDKELAPGIALGFHSHNNQQLSFALSIRFAELGSTGKRPFILDGSLCGMGRGAGNATTELVAGYLNRFHGGSYDLNEILDAIDTYIDPLKNDFQWGYTPAFFVAGSYSCHVNNIAYLKNNHRTLSRDLRLIIESLTPEERLKYDYDKLEEKFLSYSNRKIDDHASRETLRREFSGRKLLLLAPGQSLSSCAGEIKAFIAKVRPVVIGINSLPENFPCDWVFFSKPLRWRYAMQKYPEKLAAVPKIFTSNVKTSGEKNEYVVNYNLLVKRGWLYFDDSMIMFLRLLEKMDPETVSLAGFDGFSLTESFTYADPFLQGELSRQKRESLNADIASMLNDILSGGRLKLDFITPSLYREQKK